MVDYSESLVAHAGGQIRGGRKHLFDWLVDRDRRFHVYQDATSVSVDASKASGSSTAAPNSLGQHPLALAEGTSRPPRYWLRNSSATAAGALRTATVPCCTGVGVVNAKIDEPL
jgi:hypothetical protein